MATTQEIQTSIRQMIGESMEVILQPKRATFDRFVGNGTTLHAAIYIGLVAVINSILAILPYLLTGAGEFMGLMGGGGWWLGVMLGSIVSTLAGFFLFALAAYAIGTYLKNNTFSFQAAAFDKVAYSFALFFAPISLAAAVLVFIIQLIFWATVAGNPFSLLTGIGGIYGTLILLVALAGIVAQGFWGYHATKASIQIDDHKQAVITIVGALLALIIIGVIFGAITS